MGLDASALTRFAFGQVILKLLREHKSVSIKELSDMTAIQTEDIIRSAPFAREQSVALGWLTLLALVYSTLQALNLIRYYEGQHIIDISNLPERLKVTATGPTISYTYTPPPSNIPPRSPSSVSISVSLGSV